MNNKITAPIVALTAHALASDREKAIEVAVQFSGVSRDVVVEAFKHATLEHRVDVDTAVARQAAGPRAR